MNILRKLTAVAASTALILTLTSCSVTMRDTYDTPSVGASNDGSNPPALDVAEKFNSVDVAPDDNDPLGTTLPSDVFVQPEEVEKIVTIAVTGDIKLTQPVIDDARAQAIEGKDYSFLRIYTGVYRLLNDADIAIGAYSAAEKTADGIDTPEEHLEALTSLGYDVLDISGTGSDYTSLGEHEISGVSFDEEGDEAFRSFEKNGLVFTVASVGGEGHPQSYTEDKLYENLEYADLPSDMLIVLVHWDDDISNEEASAVASRLADTGADVIVGFGDALGTTERITNEKGEEALVFYSLGNLLSDAREGYALCGGVLSLTLSYTEDHSEVTAAVVPTVVHYSEGNTDFSVFRLEDYTDDQAADHGAQLDTNGLRDYIKSKISEEFLPDALK